MQLLLVAIAALVLTAPSGADERYQRPHVGLSVVVPVGWTVVREPLSPCTDPVQRIAVRRQAVLVQIVERLPPRALATFRSGQNDSLCLELPNSWAAAPS